VPWTTIKVYRLFISERLHREFIVLSCLGEEGSNLALRVSVRRVPSSESIGTELKIGSCLTQLC